MITISEGKMVVVWVQNGIKFKRYFNSEKEANRYQELLEDIQKAMKMAEEMERFNRDFKYDPQIMNLKCAEVGKEIEELKEKIRVKDALRKKLGIANQKLADEPRNIIDRNSFMKEIREVKTEINRLDRFFKEHAIVALNSSLHEAVKEMKTYYQYQKEIVQQSQKDFKQLINDVIQKFPSLSTNDKILDIKQAAVYLGVSYSTIRKLMFMEGLSYNRVGNRYRIREGDLVKWLDKRKKKETIRKENLI